VEKGHIKDDLRLKSKLFQFSSTFAHSNSNLGEFFEFKLSSQEINAQLCFLRENQLCSKVELDTSNFRFQPQTVSYALFTPSPAIDIFLLTF